MKAPWLQDLIRASLAPFQMVSVGWLTAGEWGLAMEQAKSPLVWGATRPTVLGLPAVDPPPQPIHSLFFSFLPTAVDLPPPLPSHLTVPGTSNHLEPLPLCL